MQSLFLECKPCGKKFTGKECLDQHLVSVKHMKKMLSLGIKPEQPQPVSGNPHLEVSSSVSIEEDSVRAPDCPMNTSSEECSNNTSVLGNHVTKVGINQFLCTVCNLCFSEIKEYMCHIQSKSHLEAVEKLLVLSAAPTPPDVQSVTVTSNQSNSISQAVSSACSVQAATISCSGNYFKCDVCNIICTGEEPYQAHLAGNKHKKNVAVKERERATPLVVGVNKSTLDQMMFCEVCEITCTGIVSFEQHERGDKHRKNLERKKWHASQMVAEPKNPTVFNVTNTEKSKEIPCSSLASSDESSDGEGSGSAMDWKSSTPGLSESRSTGNPFGVRDILCVTPPKDDEMQKKLEGHDVALITIDDPVTF